MSFYDTSYSIKTPKCSSCSSWYSIRCIQRHHTGPNSGPLYCVKVNSKRLITVSFKKIIRFLWNRMKDATVFFVLIIGSFTHSFEIFDTLTAEADYEGRFWWTPSRKAPLYSYKYQSLLKDSAIRKALRQEEDFRLPTNLEPTEYNLLLMPILDEKNFTTGGRVDIFFTCLEATNSITINAADLVIDTESVQVDQS